MVVQKMGHAPAQPILHVRVTAIALVTHIKNTLMEAPVAQHQMKLVTNMSSIGHATAGMKQTDLEVHVMRKYRAKQESGGMAVRSTHVYLVIIAQDTAMLVTIMVLEGPLTLTMIAMFLVHRTRAIHQRVPQVQVNVLRHHVQMANI